MAEEKAVRHGPLRVDPIVRFWRYVGPRTSTGCWPWVGATRRRGYGVIRVFDETGRLRNMVATRFIWSRLYGPIPDDILVLHRCDNPSCVRPSHLFLGDYRDNAHDRVAKGRRVRAEATGRTWQAKGSERNAGDRNGQSKLTWPLVTQIRDRYASGDRIVELASSYGVSQPAISAIVNRKSWVLDGR